AAAAAVPAVERAERAGPGFVNLWLTDAWLADALGAIIEQGRDFGAGEPARRERVQVEMVSANPTGPVTVASARNGAYGDSVARLLEFAGHDVDREYYYNDAGAQLERFRASVEAARRGEEPPEEGYRGDYVVERDLPELLALLPTYEEDGAIFVRSTEFGDDKDRVLVRSPKKGGLPTYEAADVAYLRDKLERGYDRAIYVLGADHQGVAGWF